jgi:anthranilate phosphoribosyltransferase
MQAFLARVLDGATLTQAEMAACMNAMLSGDANPAQVAALLGALRVRGETVDELAGAASAVRAMATPVVVDAAIIVDTCGTGGDGRGTFNISTAAAIVASSCGVTVAKHGNRSVSSRCGSADVLEALGVRLDLHPEALAKVIALTRLGFLFAPAHHPAFKHVAAVRRELGVRTLFNLVGPLANPANANRQVLGVFDARFAPTLAQVLARLGTQRALVLNGGGLDELSVCGPTAVSELRDGVVHEYQVTPHELGLAKHPAASLEGGDAQRNARIIRDVLEGQRGGPRDAVLANAAAALFVAAEVTSLAEGVRLAARSIDSGAADAHFERFVRVQAGQQTTLDDIVSKVRSVGAPSTSARRPGAFRAALSGRGGPTRVIAEVKRRSPSVGLIADIPDPGAHALAYVAQGAAAISVLTNEAHFAGSLADLRAVREAVQVPVLRKEFIIDPRQVDEAAHAGADAVLLIVAVLGRGLKRMLTLTRSLGLDALVEVHDQAELELALSAGAELIGVNNRDLRTFQVDLAITERLAPGVPEGVLLVAESGIKSPQDLARLRACGVANFLVGEHLVRGGVL